MLEVDFFSAKNVRNGHFPLSIQNVNDIPRFVDIVQSTFINSLKVLPKLYLLVLYGCRKLTEHKPSQIFP